MINFSLSNKLHVLSNFLNAKVLDDLQKLDWIFCFLTVDEKTFSICSALFCSSFWLFDVWICTVLCTLTKLYTKLIFSWINSRDFGFQHRRIDVNFFPFCLVSLFGPPLASSQSTYCSNTELQFQHSEQKSDFLFSCFSLSVCSSH